MEYNDFKIEPSTYEEMAKSYYKQLNKTEHKFIKYFTSGAERKILLDKIIEEYSLLSFYIDYLSKTTKATRNKSIFKKILEAKTSLDEMPYLTKTSIIKNKNLNLCEALKNIIIYCCNLIELMPFLSKFFDDIDDETINLYFLYLFSIIKNTTLLFGECRYRY